MIGKKYTSLTDGRVVEIRDIFEDIVILADGSKTKASRLLDKNYFEEYIDPKSFFNNQYLLESFAQKIKQIPDELVNKIPESETDNSTEDGVFRPRFNDLAILPADPELEKEELMRKYGIKNSSVQNEPPFLQAQKQLEQFKSLLQEIDQEEKERVEEERIESIVVNREESIITERPMIIESKIETVSKIITEDPIISMFRNVKRNNDFQMTLEIKNKIPRADFIEMMEDSYNTSIIEFLAEEFTNQILEDPEFLKNKIIDEIKNIVYSKREVKKIEATKDIEPKINKTRTTRQKKKEGVND